MAPDRNNDAEMLISRVVDGEATPADWQAFRAMAEREPSLWRDLAEYQHDHAELSAAVQAAIAMADDVEAPVGVEMHRRFAERTRLVGSFGGWAAAAAIVLVWAVGMRGGGYGSSPLNVPNNASLGPNLTHNTAAAPMTAADAYQTYLDKGQESGLVVGEVPTRVLIEARPSKSGGYEVYYLRQIMERKLVKELNTWGSDDLGRPVPVRFKVESAKPTGSF